MIRIMTMLRCLLILVLLLGSRGFAQARGIAGGSSGGSGSGGGVASVNGKLPVGGAVILAPADIGAPAIGGDVSTNTSTGAVGSTARPLAARAADLPHADDAGCPNDGVHDAGACLNNELTAISAGPRSGIGQTLLLGPYTYLVANNDLTVPPSVTLGCEGNWSVAQTVASAFSYVGLPCTLLLAPSHTIRAKQGSRLRNLIEERLGVVAPDGTIRTNINQVAAFAGTGITTLWDDVKIEDVLILGFATCINSQHSRLMLSRVYGDCTSGVLVNNSQDPTAIENLYIEPFLTSPQAAATVATFAIAGVADNGAGLIRITLAAPASPALVTGDMVSVTGVTGYTGANTTAAVTVIDSTHFDLQTAPSGTISVTGTTAAGFSVLSGLSSIAGIQYGMGITGTGIPSGAKVAYLIPTTNAVAFSAPAGAVATASGTGVALAITEGAYGAGTGTVMLQTETRSGIGVEVTNSDRVAIRNAFTFGHDEQFHFGVGAQTVLCSQCGFDNDAAIQNPYSIGLLIDGTANGNVWSGGSMASASNMIVFNAPNNFKNQVASSLLRPGIGNGEAGIQALAGVADVSTSSLLGATGVYSADAVVSLTLADLWAPQTNLYLQDAAAIPQASGTATTFANAAPPPGPATVAASGTTQGGATPLASCVTTIQSGSGGVRLFAPVPLYVCPEVVINRSGSTQRVYPPPGSSIEAFAVNVPAQVLNGGQATFLPQPITSSVWSAW